MAGTTSGFADGRHEVSPDSEEIEQTRTEGSIAKLSEYKRTVGLRRKNRNFENTKK